MINNTTRDLIANFPLGHIATVTPDGHPAVSPKGTFLVLDPTTLAFGNIRSPQTCANLRANPACETGFVDPFTRKGARLRGMARVIASDEADFAPLLTMWHNVWGDLAQRITDIVVITVDQVKPLSTPP